MNLFSIKKIARNLAIFTITLLVLGSCEKKENTIGSKFLDNEKFGTGIYRKTELLAYTTQKEKIITSGKSLNLIGAYEDPIFGMVKSGFGIQIALSEENPDFGTNPKIDSVILTMPYLGKIQGDTLMVYNTDSIYGKKELPISFKISQLTEFLHPDSTYFSNIDLPTSDEIFNNPSFTFNADSISLVYMDTTSAGADTTITHKIPAAFREKLSTDYFQRNILDMQGTAVLATNANFIKNHINGLVFETESTDGAIYSFNMFKNTSLIIYYKNDEDRKTNLEIGKDLSQHNYRLVFSNKLVRVNKYEFNNSIGDPSLIAQLTPGYDTTKGSDFIFLQGMSGTEANIKLFTDKLQLDTLREQGWLINRAELVYRVSDDNGNASAPPFRLLMANRDSLGVIGADFRIIDYIYEPTAFDGYLRSDATILDGNKERRYYKFRITNHVAAILDGELVMNEKGDYEVVYDDKTNYDIKLISFSGNESVSRVKINSSNNVSDPTKNLFLEIHYSKKD